MVYSGMFPPWWNLLVCAKEELTARRLAQGPRVVATQRALNPRAILRELLLR